MKLLITLGAASVAAALPLLGGNGDGACETKSAELSCCSAGGAGEATLASLRVPEPTFDPDSTGGIKVAVKFDGDVPEALPKLEIGGEKSKGCDAKHEVKTEARQRIVNKNGGIANVVVMVEAKGVDPVISEEPYVLDQRGCRFEPHVLVVPKGGTVRYLNSDEVNHNVHSFAKKNDPVNKNVAGGSREEQKFEKDEVIEVKCDIHPWMQSWIYVTDAARFGVTDADGNYELKGLPPGDYTVSYWHETLGKGKSEETVTVAAGASAPLELKVGEKKKKSGRGRGRKR